MTNVDPGPAVSETLLYRFDVAYKVKRCVEEEDGGDCVEGAAVRNGLTKRSELRWI